MSTMVLVGRSFLGARAWERITPLLTAYGHQVHPSTGFGDRAHLGWLPRTSIACTGDPDGPSRMPGKELITLDFGHRPTITEPELPARVLDEAARS